MTRADDLLRKVAETVQISDEEPVVPTRLWTLIHEIRAYLAEPQQEDARDAARYRWLRVNNHEPALFGVADLLKHAEYLDAAIDAALAAKVEKP